VPSATAGDWNLFGTYLYIAGVPGHVTVGCYSRHSKKRERQRYLHYANDLCGELRSGVEKRTLQLINQGDPALYLSYVTRLMRAMFWVKFLTKESRVSALEMCVFLFGHTCIFV
jgi:hypothetical protein